MKHEEIIYHCCVFVNSTVFGYRWATKYILALKKINKPKRKMTLALYVPHASTKHNIYNKNYGIID